MSSQSKIGAIQKKANKKARKEGKLALESPTLSPEQQDVLNTMRAVGETEIPLNELLAQSRSAHEQKG